MKIEIKDHQKFEYRGITATVQRRYINGRFCDWGYKVKGGGAGIGQASEHQAYEDAKWTIDRMLAKEMDEGANIS